jgi:hypothetical protein
MQLLVANRSIFLHIGLTKNVGEKSSSTCRIDNSASRCLHTVSQLCWDLQRPSTTCRLYDQQELELLLLEPHWNCSGAIPLVGRVPNLDLASPMFGVLLRLIPECIIRMRPRVILRKHEMHLHHLDHTVSGHKYSSESNSKPSSGTVRLAKRGMNSFRYLNRINKGSIIA